MGMFGVGSMVSGTLGLIGDIYSTNAQKGIASNNLALQRENFEYQKWLNSEQWNRDDTAVQRRVEDLKAAGMSPVLAAGQAATSSSPIRTEAPQQDSSWAQGYSKMADNITMAMNLTSSMATIEKQMADIAKTKAEEDYIHLQKQRGELGLQLDTQTLPYKFRLSVAEALYREGAISKQDLERVVMGYNLEQSRHYNVRTTDSTNPFNYFLGATKTIGDSLSPSLQFGGEKVSRMMESLINSISRNASQGSPMRNPESYMFPR